MLPSSCSSGRLCACGSPAGHTSSMGPGSPQGHGTLSFPSSTSQDTSGRELGGLSKPGNKLSTESEKQKQQQLKTRQQENMSIRNLESIRAHREIFLKKKKNTNKIHFRLLLRDSSTDFRAVCFADPVIVSKYHTSHNMFSI